MTKEQKSCPACEVAKDAYQKLTETCKAALDSRKNGNLTEVKKFLLLGLNIIDFLETEGWDSLNPSKGRRHRPKSNGGLGWNRNSGAAKKSRLPF